MNKVNDLFLLMFNLSQLHEKARIVERFVEGMNVIFTPADFKFIESSDEEDNTELEIRTGNSHFGFIRINQAESFSEEIRIIINNAVQMLAVILERLEFELKLQNDKISFEQIADKRLTELQSTILELRKARNASINLIEDLTAEIKKRAKTEIALNESKETAESYLNVAAEIIISLDTNGTITLLNDNGHKLLGYEKGDMIGKNWFITCIPKKEMKKVEDFHKKVITGEIENIELYENPVVTKTGEVKTILWHNTLLRDKDGNTVGTLSSGENITESKQAKELLIKSEERFRLLFNISPDALFLIDEKGKFNDANQVAISRYGYSLDEFLSMTPLNLDPSNLKEKVNQRVKNALEEETHFEWMHCSKDGREFPVEIFTKPIIIAGKPFIFVEVRDITERKKAEQALLQASENWNRTFHSMHSGIMLMDADQKIIQSNKSFQDFVNSADVDHQGKHCFHLVHGTNCPIDGCPYVRMKQSKSRESIEMVINGRDCEIIVDPILDAKGNISGTIHILNDITQRKYDEHVQQILYEISKTSSSINAIEDLVVLIRQELSKVLNFNNFFVALYNPNTNTLRRIEDEKDDFVERKADNSLSGYVIKSGKTLLVNKEGINRFAEEHHIELMGTVAECWLGVPLVVNQKAIGVVVVQSYSNAKAYDQKSVRLMQMIAHELNTVIERTSMIHDLVAAKEHAEESDRLKSAFLHNISHEIRTPMNAIMGFSEFLNDPDLLPEKRNHFIDIIVKSSNQLLFIINDIVSISTIESGQERVLEKEVNINTICNLINEQFLIQAKAQSVTLLCKTTLADNEANIISDETKLTQILTNLVGNALKFTQHGHVDFGYVVKGNQLEFYVKDTGIGIPAEMHNEIFKRFRQVETTNTRQFGGSGLGLSISKAYVELLGGSIWLTSEPDKGSTFYFTLPFNAAGSQNISSKQSVSGLRAERKKSKTILIAEDHDSNFMLLEEFLLDLNVSIIRAVNGIEALEICKKQHIDLILMDIKMPEMDGYQATRLIKEFMPDIPIIVQTAYTMNEEKEQALKVGCNNFLSKPLKKVDLLSMINQLWGDDQKISGEKK